MTPAAHRIETTLQSDGTLTLDHLPFRAGDAVEVTVQARTSVPQTANHYPLRGTALHYDRPTEPVAVEEWEATR